MSIIERLDRLDIPYTLEHHKAVHTVEEASTLHLSLEGMRCRNAFLRDKAGRFVLAMSPSDHRFDLKAIQAAVGCGRLSFASAEELEAVLGIQPGGVTPLSVCNAAPGTVSVAIPQSLRGQLLIVHGDSCDTSLSIAEDNIARFVVESGQTVIYF